MESAPSAVLTSSFNDDGDDEQNIEHDDDDFLFIAYVLSLSLTFL